MSGRKCDILDAFLAIGRRREIQDCKHGTIQEHPHDIAAWILMIEHWTAKAKARWIAGDVDQSLDEITDVAALATACLEQHGLGRSYLIPNR